MSVDHGLRNLFRVHLPRFDWCTVELGLASRGVPDANYCYDGVEGWIEFKSTKFWKIHVRPEQVGWAERRLAAGGRVFCAVRRATTELWLYHGRELRTLLSTRLDEVPCLGQWDGGSPRWDWDAVGKLLSSKK